MTAATVARMERAGEVIRLARVLYPLPDAPLDSHHSLAEAAKRLPKGVVCHVSALAFHELTDQLPRKVWMAIGRNDWTPRPGELPIRVLRFADDLFVEGVETHVVEGVPVKVFGVPRPSRTASGIAARSVSRLRLKGCKKRCVSEGRRRLRSRRRPSEAELEPSSGPIWRPSPPMAQEVKMWAPRPQADMSVATASDE